MTPIQNMIAHLEGELKHLNSIKLTSEGEHERIVTGLILGYAKSLLPAEQQLISDTWDASWKRKHQEEQYKRFDDAKPASAPDKETYLTKINEVK